MYFSIGLEKNDSFLPPSKDWGKARTNDKKGKMIEVLHKK